MCVGLGKKSTTIPLQKHICHTTPLSSHKSGSNRHCISQVTKVRCQVHLFHVSPFDGSRKQNSSQADTKETHDPGCLATGSFEGRGEVHPRRVSTMAESTLFLTSVIPVAASVHTVHAQTRARANFFLVDNGVTLQCPDMVMDEANWPTESPDEAIRTVDRECECRCYLHKQDYKHEQSIKWIQGEAEHLQCRHYHLGDDPSDEHEANT